MKTFITTFGSLALAGWLLAPLSLDAQETTGSAVAGEQAVDEPVSDANPKKKSNWNVPMYTGGGKQFWTDELVHGKWRIQRNVLSKHCRLLDARDKRRAWGDWESCLETWNELRKEENVPPLKKKVVIVLHGLGRTRGAMEGMAQYLAENGDYTALNMSYASTRATIGDHAKALAKIVGQLEGVTEINFVAHSMGNLVIRHYIGDQMAAAGKIDSRIHRFVMIAPPNSGTQLAERFKKNPVFRVVFGKSGTQMGADWEELQKRLATPTCSFGIVAGGGKNGDGRNPLLKGDDDLVVSVKETQLAGATDFVVVPVIHTTIMDDETVREYSLRFLKEGFFISETRRHPIRSLVVGPRE